MKTAKKSPVVIPDEERWVGFDWWTERLGVTRRSVERYIILGTIPQPVRFGGALRWRVSTARAHMDAMERAAVRAR
jgi:predicted DNA-binding transcriptional regulator AlpA